jgi:acetyl esterase/lipase
VTLVGDSAGGGLSLALAQRLRDARRPLPPRIVLLSPWLDLTISDPRQGAIARTDPMLDIPGLRAAGRWYADDLSPDDPAVSPLFGDLAGLPPIALFAGTNDLVFPDSDRLRARAREAGVDLTYREYLGLFHIWPMAGIPEGERAMDEMAAYLSGRL